MAKPLKERIQAALEPSSRVTTIDELIQILPSEIKLLEQQHAQAEQDSLNLALQEADQEESAALAHKLEREIERLKFARSQLRELKQERITSDRAKQQLANYETAEAKRDAVADELCEFWNNEMPQLLTILGRMRESTDEIYNVNRSLPGNKAALSSAEHVARGMDNESYRGGGMPTYIEKMRIPDWGNLGGTVWPPHTAFLGGR